MSDFKTKIQGYTCISEEYKKLLIASADRLAPEKQQQILTALDDGENKKRALEIKAKKTQIEVVKKNLEKVKEFKRGPLREATKKAEGFVQKSDEAKAEDLLKDL